MTEGRSRGELIAMNITLQSRNGVSILKLVGDIMADTELVATVSALMEKPRYKIVLDLSEVGMINSAGLGDLVRLTAQSNTLDGEILFTDPAPFVADILETTRLNRFLQVHDSIEDALAALA